MITFFVLFYRIRKWNGCAGGKPGTVLLGGVSRPCYPTLATMLLQRDRLFHSVQALNSQAEHRDWTEDLQKTVNDVSEKVASTAADAKQKLVKAKDHAWWRTYLYRMRVENWVREHLQDASLRLGDFFVNVGRWFHGVGEVDGAPKIVDPASAPATRPL